MSPLAVTEPIFAVLGSAIVQVTRSSEAEVGVTVAVKVDGSLRS